MSDLRQEIQDFHESLKPTLEKVLSHYGQETPQKIYHTIIVPCKKLLQKCSFKSLLDASTLCSLAYWLYIDGQKALALEICEHTHGVDFVYEPFWNGGYPAICGLEIRIARELFQENRRNQIPPKLLEYYFSKSVQKQIHYPQILREEKIKSCSGRLLTVELLESLYNMIGKGETGLYAPLNRNWTKIEETISFYLDYLHFELSEK